VRLTAKVWVDLSMPLHPGKGNDRIFHRKSCPEDQARHKAEARLRKRLHLIKARAEVLARE